MPYKKRSNKRLNKRKRRTSSRKRSRKPLKKYRGGGMLDSLKELFRPSPVSSQSLEVPPTVGAIHEVDQAVERAKNTAQDVLNIESECLQKVQEAAIIAKQAAEEAKDAADRAQQIADNYLNDINFKKQVADQKLL